MLTASGLSKSFGETRALVDVDLAVGRGEIVGLLGPNGAGKTSVIRIVSGELRPDAGEVLLDGEPLHGRSALRGRIGLVPQEVSLDERLTARENLAFFGRLYGLAGAGLAERVETRLSQVDLLERADEPVAQLSGGMRRRLNIAAGLLHDPDLLLLDEPTVGVDPQLRAYLHDVVRSVAESGTAVLYTTHYLEEAERICARVTILDHGSILAEGTREDLLSRLTNRRVLELAAESIDPAQASSLAKELGGVAWDLENGRVRLRMDPSDSSLVEVALAAQRLGIATRSVSVEDASLESIFLDLTGRGLRD